MSVLRNRQRLKHLVHWKSEKTSAIQRHPSTGPYAPDNIFIAAMAGPQSTSSGEG